MNQPSPNVPAPEETLAGRVKKQELAGGFQLHENCASNITGPKSTFSPWILCLNENYQNAHEKVGCKDAFKGWTRNMSIAR